jgi:hypothetical protein
MTTKLNLNIEYMPRFNYVNTDKPELLVDMSRGRSNNDSKVIYKFSEWDKGLRSRTKKYRNNAKNRGRKCDFINMNYMGGNMGSGFHKHMSGPNDNYKYRFKRHIDKEKEVELDEEDVIAQRLVMEGGDTRGYRKLDTSTAKELRNFRKKKSNKGDNNHGKGYYGAGLLRSKYQEEVNNKNNNKEAYKNVPDNEFSSLSVGIIKNKLKTETLKIPPANDGL